MSATVFRNATVFDGSAYRGAVGDVVVVDGRISAVDEEAAPVGATVVDVAGGLLLPGFTDAHVHPVQGGLERLGCDLSGCPPTATAYLAPPRRTPPPTPTSTGSRAAAGRWRPSPAACPRRPSSTRRCRTARSPWPTATTTGCGSTPGRSSSPGSPQPRRTLLTGTSSATPAAPDRRAPRGRDGPARRRAPGRRRRRCTPRCWRASGYLLSLGITELAGRDRRALLRHARPRTDVRPGRRQRATSPARWSGALWWDRDRGAEQVAELVEKREDWTRGRFAATRGEDHAGRRRRELHRRARRALPRPLRPRRPTTPASRSSTRELLRDHVRALDAPRLPGPLPRPGRPRRSARRSTPSRARDPARRTTSRTSSSCTPTTSPRFAQARRRGQHPGALGLPRRPDDRAHHPLPRGGARGPAVPLRGPARRGRAARGRQRLAGQHPDPLAAIHTAVHRTSYGEPAPAGTDPFLPGAGTPGRGGLRRLHERVGAG